MPPDAATILNELERAICAAMALTRAMLVSQAPDDQWLRMPSTKGRCPISQWSRSKIYRLTKQGAVRSKHVGTSAFYSASDVRAILQNQNQHAAH